ncbi:MAG: FkbM family methyltransferase [Nitrospirota bacterium]
MSHLKKIIYNRIRLSLHIRSDADDSVFNEIFIERDYKDLEAIITKATNQIIDIGGHTGMFAIYARTLNPNVPITTYEPGNENFKTLKENLKQNHIKNIQAKNLAISSKQGQATLYLSEDSHNHSLTKKSDKTQITQTTTLAHIIKAKTDLVKIDAEGAEFEIIESTPLETLKLIKTIYIEYHRSDSTSLTQKLQKAGFHTKTKPSHYDSSMGFILAKA